MRKFKQICDSIDRELYEMCILFFNVIKLIIVFFIVSFITLSLTIAIYTLVFDLVY